MPRDFALNLPKITVHAYFLLLNAGFWTTRRTGKAGKQAQKSAFKRRGKQTSKEACQKAKFRNYSRLHNRLLSLPTNSAQRSDRYEIPIEAK